jgi:hypothetical protein
VNPRDAIYEGDTHYSIAESRWFGRELQQRLDTLLGKGWGDADSFPNSHPGHRHLTIERFKDIVRFDEILPNGSRTDRGEPAPVEHPRERGTTWRF